MKRENGIMKALSFYLLLVCLIACTPAPKQADTYTSGNGEIVVLGDRDACESACNTDYDRCGDSMAAGEVVGRGQMTGIFGGNADCKSDLRSCLSACKGR